MFTETSKNDLFRQHTLRQRNQQFTLHIFKECLPKLVFKNALRKFEDRDKKAEKDKEEEEHLCRIGTSYFGKPSHKFTKRLSALVKTKFQADLFFYCTSFKTGSILI